MKIVVVGLAAAAGATSASQSPINVTVPPGFLAAERMFPLPDNTGHGLTVYNVERPVLRPGQVAEDLGLISVEVQLYPGGTALAAPTFAEIQSSTPVRLLALDSLEEENLDIVETNLETQGLGAGRRHLFQGIGYYHVCGAKLLVISAVADANHPPAFTSLKAILETVSVRC